MKRLVLFDIDGTLVVTGGAGRAALKAALEKVYGTAGSVETFPLGGSLDRMAVKVLMTEAGFAPDHIWARFEEFGQAMESDLRARLAAGLHPVKACPGGRELVKALAARGDALVGLVTGNFRATAFLKLEAAGYDPAMFQVGAFGHEAEDRGDLPPMAMERAAAMCGIRFKGPQVVVIGDTPFDVACGKGVGGRTIAVMTGWSTREALEAAGPDILFEDLSEIEKVIESIFAG